jgi:hypothetical protein
LIEPHPARYSVIVLISVATAVVFTGIYWLFHTYLRGLF